MRKLSLVIAVLAVFALTAVAFAAKPKSGTYQGDTLSVHVKHGKVTKVSGKAGGSCSSAVLVLKKHAKVSHGKFHVKGSTDGGTLSVSGKFKTRTHLKGTYKFVKGSCSTGKHKFDATLGDVPD
jgi:hypothetical protein